MPIKPTYPGVYIEEVPSGVRTITGVATAITAFIGRAIRGPVNEPIRIQSFGGYQRRFGGLSRLSTMSYSVQHFFLNGGTDAVLVRVYRLPSAEQVAAGANADGVANRVLGAYEGAAAGLLTLAVQPEDGDAMTLGSRTYTFQESLTDADGNIAIGADLESTRARVVGALRLSGTAGTDYAASMTAHAAVNCADAFSGSGLRLAAKEPGPAGNDIVTRSDFDSDENGFDDTTLGTVRPGIEPTGGAAAQGTLTLANNPSNDESITIGSRTYTFQDTLTAGNGHVHIGAGVAATRSNLVAALRLEGGTPGTDYSTATTPHDTVAAAAAFAGTDLVLSAREVGAAGNAIVTTSTFANANNEFDGTTLGQTRAGADPSSFTLAAANPGAWANNLVVRIDHLVADPSDPSLFNLEVAERDPSLPATAPPARTEKYYNLSIDPESPLFVTRVLEARSDMVRVQAQGTNLPAASPDGVALAGGGDGQAVTDAEISGPSLSANKKGIWALEKTDLFNLLCIPPLQFGAGGDIGTTTRDAALKYCKEQRAFFILDPPLSWADVDAAVTGVDQLNLRDENVAVYFPRVRMTDPLRDNQLSTFAPCGVVAGVFARTDARRGVWKAPAGTDATMAGVRQLDVSLTDGENGRLNPLGVNALRTFPVTGNVVWGARTLEGADPLASEWKYIPVRRVALYIEESLYRGMQWVVFEPNDEPLWSQIRLNVGSFMHTLFRQGAFQGSSPRDAYLVKCDKETTTQADVDRGVVNVLVGFAPLKPAEFVFIKIQQLAGQLQA